jgi:uncharacterized protein (TIGR02246 family)
MRILVALTALMLLATPSFAQQKLNESEASKISEQAAAKFDTAWNKGDIKGLGSLFSQDATFVTPVAMVTGREEIEKNMELRAGKSHHTSMPEKVHVLGPETIWSAGTYNVEGGSNSQVPSFKGRWSAVNIHEADGWRMQFLTINVTPPPSAQSAQNPPMAGPTTGSSMPAK